MLTLSAYGIKAKDVLIMYRQSRTDTRDFLARKAIKAVFDKNFYREQEALALSFQQYLSSKGAGDISDVFRFSWMKQSRRMITYRLTSTLIQTLPLRWQRMAEMHYASEDRQVKICNDLYLSVSTLNNWDMRLLNMVINYAILLRLSKEDVFHLPRLVNMVNALSDMLMLIKKLDPAEKGQLVSPAFTANLRERLSKYREIISVLDGYKLNYRNGMMPMIVTAKCNNPEATAPEIADICNMHASIVGKYLKNFQNEISPYLL